MEYKRFGEWNAVGRSVIAGQKAHHYLVSPDRSERAAVFAEDQTEPLTVIDHSGWVLIPTEELEPAGKRRLGTKGYIKVDAAKNGGTTIWCGSDKDIIKLLKKRGYIYSMKLHRWFKADANPVEVADIMEKAEYTVDRDFDPDAPAI